MKAMLFAAGLGTRLKPFTLNNPKALALVNGKSLLERNITYLKSCGITDFVINIHHFGDKLVQFLEDNNHFGVTIAISDESDEVLETGGGLVKAQDHFTEDFLVMNTDILTTLNIQKFINYHNQHKPMVTLAVTDRNSSRKLLFEDNFQLSGWKNLLTEESILIPEKNYNPFAFSGIHVVNPSIFEKMPKEGKFSIMKTYMELMFTEKIIGFNHSEDVLIDVGRPESVLEAEKVFK